MRDICHERILFGFYRINFYCEIDLLTPVFELQRIRRYCKFAEAEEESLISGKSLSQGMIAAFPILSGNSSLKKEIVRKN